MARAQPCTSTPTSSTSSTGARTAPSASRRCVGSLLGRPDGILIPERKKYEMPLTSRATSSLIGLSHSNHLLAPVHRSTRYPLSPTFAPSLSRLAQPLASPPRLEERPRTQSKHRHQLRASPLLVSHCSATPLPSCCSGRGHGGAVRSLKPARPSTPHPHSQGGVERRSETHQLTVGPPCSLPPPATTMHVFVRSLEGQSLSFGECAALHIYLRDSPSISHLPRGRHDRDTPLRRL
jgi:hypothetical protein